jgi:hypothetical protein
MSRRRTTVRWLACGAFAGCCFAAFTFREPSHGGRSLGWWLSRVTDRNSSAETRAEAEQAIRCIGAPRCVPVLLRKFHAVDSPLCLELNDLLRRYARGRFRFQEADDEHEQARVAFQILGNAASGAMPDLERAFRDTNLSSRAACSLVFVATPERAIALFSAGMTNEDFHIRGASVVGCFHLGTNAWPLKSQILAARHDPSRWISLTAFGWIRRNLPVTESVPLMVDGVAHPDPAVRSLLMMELAEMGPATKPCAGKIAQLLHAPESHVREDAFKILQTIDPESRFH